MSGLGRTARHHAQDHNNSRSRQDGSLAFSDHDGISHKRKTVGTVAVDEDAGRERNVGWRLCGGPGLEG